MLDKNWHRQLKKYIDAGTKGDDPENEYPGPIDNSPLCELGNYAVPSMVISVVWYWFYFDFANCNKVSFYEVLKYKTKNNNLVFCW